MAKRSPLYHKTLREQVYDYIRASMERGELAPGSPVDLNRLSDELRVSKTPLRFALCQLERDGFVTILPRRACMVNVLTLGEIRSIYQIIGALEASVVLAESRRITSEIIAKMRLHNEAARRALDDDDFNRFYDANLKLHDSYLLLTSNTQLIRIVHTLKNRLYDFPRKKRFVKDWEVRSTGEHEQFIILLESGHYKSAADYIRDVHWSYEVQERFIEQYYVEAMGSVKSKSMEKARVP